MTIARTRQQPIKLTKLSPKLKLWMLRMLVCLGAQREFINQHGFHDDHLAELLGLGKWINLTRDEFDTSLVRAELRKIHLEAESKKGKQKQARTCLERNITRLAQLIGLTETDCRILEFSVLIHIERHLDNVGDWIGNLSTVKIYHVMAAILDIPETEIRASLTSQSLLSKSGLVTIDHRTTGFLQSKLDLLTKSFASNIASEDTDPLKLLRDRVSLAPLPHLSHNDYQHCATPLAILMPYLQYSLDSGRQGVNVLIYGSPGTGKSQLARVLAQHFKCELFEVASEDSNGNAVDGESRLRAFRAAQCLLLQRRVMIAFDEVEDVFDDGDELFGRKSTAQTRKAWINRLLEDNPVPTIWLSNSIDGIDPAFIRRFDMVLEVPVPSRQQRNRIIANACSDLIDPQTLRRIAESEALAPAVITRAASVIRSIRDELGDDKTASAFELLINNTLEAQGHRPVAKNDANRLPELYDPSFVHADADLAAIADGIITSKSGRLCLYGPPGTGKTAYGRWLAEKMGTPLVVKRASDLMSKWVGGTEQNIAHSFQQAEEEGALLLIDEVDSFLQDRRGAQRSWEVSLVNEMLTQMESYSGIFLASTNLMTGLDQAALRRFDLKVKFDYLKPQQAWELMQRYCQQWNIPLPTPQIKARIERMQNLTPGDFAAIARQARFRPLTSPQELLAALEAECCIKEGSQASMGFL